VCECVRVLECSCNLRGHVDFVSIVDSLGSRGRIGGKERDGQEILFKIEGHWSNLIQVIININVYEFLSLINNLNRVLKGRKKCLLSLEWLDDDKPIRWFLSDQILYSLLNH
jgi:hypothetical protein